MIHVIQPLSCKRAMLLAGEEDACEIIDRVYGVALAYENKRIWANSCNKTSWLVLEIAKLFPRAKFVHFVRDGRRVTSSYYHKLADECYENSDVGALLDWI